MVSQEICRVGRWRQCTVQQILPTSVAISFGKYQGCITAHSLKLQFVFLECTVFAQSLFPTQNEWLSSGEVEVGVRCLIRQALCTLSGSVTAIPVLPPISEMENSTCECVPCSVNNCMTAGLGSLNLFSPATVHGRWKEAACTIRMVVWQGRVCQLCAKLSTTGDC
jgi:hypothetical protein